MQKNKVISDIKRLRVQYKYRGLKSIDNKHDKYLVLNIHTHIHARTHNIQTHARTRTHAHAHAHRHAHTNTHKHTNQFSQPY